MGILEKQIEISDNESLTVREIIDRFGPEPFLEMDAA
jgi:hypothetical protein